MSKLLLLPWSFVADYCLPSTGEIGHSLTPYFVNDNFLSSFGIVPGMVVVTRKIHPGETPPDNSFCYVWLEGELYFGRVGFDSNGLISLEDDTARKEFDRDKIEFEAVALYACSCNRLGALCTPKLLSVETGLTIFRQKAGVLRWETDATGYLKISDEMREWLLFAGAKPEEWKGWGWAKFLHPEDAAAFTTRWRESLEAGGPYLNQGRVFFGGAWVYMASSANPIRDAAGQIVGWEGFLHLEAVESRKSA